MGAPERFASEPVLVEPMTLRLYVAGRSPNSRRALINLQAICQEHLSDHYQLEVIDVLDDPMAALQDNILVTPTLIKVAPASRKYIVGDLSETPRVLVALGIHGSA